MKMKLKTEFSEYPEVFLEVGEYQADGSPAVELYTGDGELITVITVCLMDLFLEAGESYVDTNNCPWALDFIKEYSLGEPTGRTRKSGFCTYPLVRFDMEKLKEFAFPETKM
ncbi:MAG: DUF4313 domain-containing protein [Lachnospiraceae bacterium]|nr:DUF4313 domain-containing protein [Lachnospiraceae bacterium]